MAEPDPQVIIDSIANLTRGMEKMAESARTIPAPVWRIVEEIVQGQVHTLYGLQRLLKAVVEGGGAL